MILGAREGAGQVPRSRARTERPSWPVAGLIIIGATTDIGLERLKRRF